MNRPYVTLFMMMSADGKISTGSSDELDVDRDFPQIEGVREGLHQYYEIEQTTDLWSINSGRVLAKIGVNESPAPAKTPVSFVAIDNTHLTKQGIRHMCAKSARFVLVTSNKTHPAFSLADSLDNLSIIDQERLNLGEMLEILKNEFGCERITLQTGGTLNGLFLREKLIDAIDIVIAPVLIGGKDTASLIDGVSLGSRNELNQLGVLKLERCEMLEDSYIRLRYSVIS